MRLRTLPPCLVSRASGLRCPSEQKRPAPTDDLQLRRAFDRALAGIRASGLAVDVPAELLDGLPEVRPDLDRWEREVIKALESYGPTALFRAALRLLAQAREALPEAPEAARLHAAGARRLAGRLGTGFPPTLLSDLDVETAITEAWLLLAEGRDAAAKRLIDVAEQGLARGSCDPLLESLLRLTRAYTAARSNNLCGGYRELVAAYRALEGAGEPWKALEDEPELAAHLRGDQSDRFPSDARVRVSVHRLLARCGLRKPDAT